jgi:hypothetical protein
MKAIGCQPLFGYSIIGVLVVVGILSLHVWAWRESRSGLSVNWHARMSSDRFCSQTP